MVSGVLLTESFGTMERKIRLRLLHPFFEHIPLPALNRAMQAPWYLWIGGFLGVIYLTATIILAPLLGAATMVGLIVPG